MIPFVFLLFVRSIPAVVAKPALPAAVPPGSIHIPATANHTLARRALRLPLLTSHRRARLRRRLPDAAPVPRRFRSRVLAAGARPPDVRARCGSNSDSWRPSRRVDFCHAVQRGEKVRPRLPLLAQRFFALRHELVIPPPPLPGLFDPRAFDQAAFFHPVEQRVER